MKCIIPHQCLKTLVRAVWSLAKIGDEVYVEAQAKALYLKTTNCAKTAFVCVTFYKDFFLSYEYPSTDDPDHSTMCKLPMRPFLNVFKSLPSLEKLVDHCSITLEESHPELVISFRYKLGFVKSHHLGFQDCDKLQAVFFKTDNHILISGSTKVLQEVAGNFPASLDEVSVKATSGNLTFKSYFEDEQTQSRVGFAEIKVSAGEFETFSIKEDTTVVFSLKTMRALLSFAETAAHNFDLRIEGRGKPAIFSLNNYSDYEIDVVMATLVDPEPFQQTSVSQVSVEVGGNTKKESNLMEEQVNRESKEEVCTSMQHVVEKDSTDQFLGNEPFDVMDFDSISSPPVSNPLFVPNDPSAIPPNTSTSRMATFAQVPEPREEDSLRDADFGLAHAHESSVKEDHPGSVQITDELFGMFQGDCNSPDQQDDCEFIPATPEANKYGDLLWTEDTQTDQELVPHEEQETVVLAPDSDPDDL